MLVRLSILRLFTDICTIFQLKRRKFPCFCTILHWLFSYSRIYLQHFFTGGRPISPERIEN
ncbi:hypothetical protein IY41_00940 [Phocaeicola dorei]|nr:hypothetical protein IY41_00940 [Phocaeicola dorei]